MTMPKQRSLKDQEFLNDAHASRLEDWCDLEEMGAVLDIDDTMIAVYMSEEEDDTLCIRQKDGKDDEVIWVATKDLPSLIAKIRDVVADGR
jgi:hypothetical protein